jgi:hypothetical protein
MAAGFAMTASVGLAVAGPASAASPAVLHIKPGSEWTAKLRGLGCELETFAADHTFTGDTSDIPYGTDAGTWSGGDMTISMIWSRGPLHGWKFTGTFTKTPVKEYRGTFTGPIGDYTGKLVKGDVSGC